MVDYFVFHILVNAPEADSKDKEPTIFPIVFRRRKKTFRTLLVLDLKKAIRKVLGIPPSHQILRGPLPAKVLLRDFEHIMVLGIIPGLQAQKSLKHISAGELFTTIAVSTAKTRINLAKDLIVLETKHPIREYISPEGLHYHTIQNPCISILVCTAEFEYNYLRNIGKFALPKPRVWFDLEKKILKRIMIEQLDDDVPLEVKEQFEHMEL